MSDPFWLLVEGFWPDGRREAIWPKAQEPHRLNEFVQAVLQVKNYVGAPPSLLWDPPSKDVDYIEIESVRDASLCSERFLDALRKVGDHPAAYPIEVLRPDMGLRAARPLFLWIPAQVDGAIDWKGSERYADRQGRLRLTKLVLNDSVGASGQHIFRVQGSTYLLADDRVRISMQEANVFGVAFAPLDSIYMPWEGVKTEALRRHLVERPDDDEGWYELGRLLGGLHRPREALDALDHALDLRPAWNEALYFRGVVLQQLARNLEALANFNRALEQGQLKYPPIAYMKLLRDMSRGEDALAVAERVIDTFPESPIAWLELGAAHAGLENFPMALYAFNQAHALGIDAYRDDFFAAKGEALYRLGQYQEAVDTFDEGLRSSGSGIELLRGKAKTLRALGRAIEADLIEEHARSIVNRSQETSRQPDTT